MFRLKQITRHLVPSGTNMHLHQVRTASSRSFPGESFGIDLQRDMLHGSSIALHLNTEAPAGSKPLRVALSSTGLSKDLIQETKVKGRTQYFWSPNELLNMAVIGEDVSELTGEDALIVGFCGAENNRVAHKFEAIPSTLSKDVFLHTSLPASVARPTTTKRVESVVFGVADGVGGMASYGDRNQTAYMSHALLTEVRNNLTRDTYSAKALLQRSWRALGDNDAITLGACTASLGLIKPIKGDVRTKAEFNEYLPETAVPGDDGQRALLDCVNVGDSTVIAFRPVKNGDDIDYELLALTWPLHHKHNSGNPPPMQLVMARPAGASDVQQPLYGADDDFSTSTSARTTDDPTASRRIVSSDYTGFRKTHSDQPWLGSEARAVLQRGDIVMAFSDGVGDNLRHHIFSEPLISACSAAAKYIAGAYTEKALSTCNLPPFRTIGHDNHIPNSEQIAQYTGVAPAAPATLSCDEECIIAGNYTSLLASTVIRLCQRSVKVDDMSLVVAVVY